VKALSVSALKADAALVTGVGALLTAIWAASGVSGFWPRDTLIWLGGVLVAHAGLTVSMRQPSRWPLTAGLLAQIVVSGVWWLCLVLEWLVGPSSGFWPGWVLVAVVVAGGAHFAVTVLLGRSRRTLTKRDRRVHEDS
jgi:hypothetical protein